MPSLLPANEDRPPTLNKKRIPIPCTHSLSLSLFVSLSLSLSLYISSSLLTVALLCFALLCSQRLALFNPSHFLDTQPSLLLIPLLPCLLHPPLTLELVQEASSRAYLVLPSLSTSIISSLQPANRPTRAHTHTHDPGPTDICHQLNLETPCPLRIPRENKQHINHPNPRPNDNDWPQLADHGR